MFNKPDKRRFYDQDPLLKEMTSSLRALETLDLQVMVARQTVHYMYHHSDLRQLLKDVRKIGMKKLMGVKAAQKGTRWYDKDPSLQKLFLNLYLLEVTHQRHIAQKVIEVLHIVRLYQLHCYAIQSPIQEELLGKLIQDYYEQPTLDATVLFTHRLFTFMLNKVTDAIDEDRQLPGVAQARQSVTKNLLRPFKKVRRRQVDLDEFSRELFQAMAEQPTEQQVLVARRLLDLHLNEQCQAEAHSPLFVRKAVALTKPPAHFMVLAQPSSRWYDQHVVLRQFFILFNLCQLDYQKKLVKSALPVLDLLKQYEKQCLFLGENLRDEAIVAMLDKYFSFQSQGDALAYSDRLKTRFAQNRAESEALYHMIMASLTQGERAKADVILFPPEALAESDRFADEAPSDRAVNQTLGKKTAKKRLEDLAQDDLGMKVTESVIPFPTYIE